MDEQSDFLKFRDLFFEFGGGDRFGLGVLVGKTVFLQRALVARGRLGLAHLRANFHESLV